MRRQRLGKIATVVGLAVVIGVMTTAVSYSVTLYRLFCAVTGAGGTTQRVARNTATVSDRTVRVSFDTNVAPGLPWRFRPVQDHVTLHLGQDALVFFEAENRTDQPITGHATFNVTPAKAGIYFKKTECFCFTEETLDPHARVQMPVDFFVDPRLGTDPGTQDVREITLSYTFFRSANPAGAKDLARFVAPGDAAVGERLFAAQCSGCHALDRSKVGPALGRVVGRRAGSLPGYPYSAALAGSGIIWSEPMLDRWLAGPQALVPGAQMPERVPEEAARRALIAYLKAGAS